VSGIRHEYVGTATGLMLTLAAVGGFFIPIIFGHLVAHTSFDTGWVFLAIVTVAFALIGLAGRNATSDAPEPAMVPASYAAGPAGPRSTEEEAV
jgi:nitrate/nitrite transporter NarK